jgi:hypothetical protein
MREREREMGMKCGKIGSEKKDVMLVFVLELGA